MHYPDFPFKRIHLKETNSTSSYLRTLCNTQATEEFTVISTDFQTAGRGQRGNSWESEEKKNLLFSLLLTPSFLPANEQFILSQVVSLSIKEELDTYGSGFSIKWPNDIYWNDKKICGILIENDLQGSYLSQSIAGICININQEAFHSSAPNPVSLKQITGKEHDLNSILENILCRLDSYYKKIQSGYMESISQTYYNALFRKEVFAGFSDKNGKFTARIIRVEPSGLLVVADKDGMERSYAFKEISYIL